jgi:ferrous iron transport protein A
MALNAKRGAFMTLNDIAIGDSCVVTKLNDTGEIRRRIMDMGLTKGATVSVRKVAPLGDPIDLIVRGYHLSLRREDAKMIEVEPA